MNNRKTFPKEGIKKLKETISELKALLRQREKEIQFLKVELENLVKPLRDRKPHTEQNKMSYDQWRKDFIRRWKRDVQGKE